MKHFLFLLLILLQVQLIAQINPTAALMPTAQDSMFLLSKLSVDGKYRYYPTLLSDVLQGGGQDNLGNHTATEELKMAGFKITNLASPSGVSDAATKAYVDGHVDSDSNPTNEIETWSTLSGIPADIADGDDVGLSGSLGVNQVAYSLDGLTVTGNNNFSYSGSNLQLNGRAGFGITPSTYRFDLYDAGINLMRLGTASSGVSGVNLYVYQNSLSPSAIDIPFQLRIQANNSSMVKQDFALFEFTTKDVTAGSEDGGIRFRSKKDGVFATRFEVIPNRFICYDVFEVDNNIYFSDYPNFDFLGTNGSGLIQGSVQADWNLSGFNNDISAGQSIFNADGTLTSNRTLLLDGKSLFISSSNNGGFALFNPSKGQFGFVDGTNTSLIEFDATSTTISQTGTGSAASIDITKEQITIDGQFRQTGKLSPSNLTATTHNWNPTGLETAYKIRVNMTAPQSITGIEAQEDGVRILIYNVSTQNLTLEFLDSGSLSVNQFKGLPDYTDYVIPGGATREIIYDDTDSGWTLISN